MNKILQNFILPVLLFILKIQPVEAVDLEPTIGDEYRAFRALSSAAITARVPQYADVMPRLRPAVQFLLYLMSTPGANRYQKGAMVLGRGAGVGGIDESRTANDDESRVMFNILHVSVKGGATLGDFQLRSLRAANAVGRHQTVVMSAFEVVRERGKWSSTQSFDLIRDVASFNAFRQAVYTRQTGKGIAGTQHHSRMFFGNVGQTQQYPALGLPTAPVLHTYNPISIDPGNDFAPGFAVCAKLPIDPYRLVLPSEIQTAVGALGAGEVDFYFIPQSWNWQSPTLYRPQYWLDPTAPSQQANYNKTFAPSISFWRTPAGPTISQNVPTFQDGGFSTHSGGDDGITIVSSAANCPIEHLITGSKGQSVAFWSIISHAGRHAVTLHWLLSEVDQRELENIGTDFNPRNFTELSDRIANHRSLSNLYLFT
jgi:hypothetical protein